MCFGTKTLYLFNALFELMHKYTSTNENFINANLFGNYIYGITPKTIMIFSKTNFELVSVLKITPEM